MVDLMNKKCSCGKGLYIERYMHNDWNGTLSCNVCNKETKRYISEQDYRNQQINKVLHELTR